MMARVRSALVAVLVALPAFSAAQQAAPTLLPYEPQLLRLSEILGALHYLVRLCDSQADERWRDQMEALIEAEQPDVERRARMVDRFNRGYEGYRSVYRQCTPAAELAIDRYIEEGAAIAADVASRYRESDG